MWIFAIPGVKETLAAVFAIVAYFGATYLAKFVDHTIPSSNVPVIGTILNTAKASIDATVQWFRNFLRPYIAPVLAFLTALTSFIWHYVGKIVDVFREALNTAEFIVTKLIPDTVAWLQHWAGNYFRYLQAFTIAQVGHAVEYLLGRIETVFKATIGYVDTKAGELWRALQADIGVALSTIDTLGRWVTAELAALATRIGHDINELRSWTAQNILGLEAGIASAVTAIEGDIAEGVQAAERFAAEAATAAAAAAIGVLTTDVAHVAEQAWIDIRDEAIALEGVIASDLPDLGAAVRSIPRTLATDLPGVIAGVETVAVPMLRYMRECGVPNCKNLGRFGHILHDLGGLIGEGALLTLVIEMATRPVETAHDIATVTTDVTTGLAREFRDLIGI